MNELYERAVEARYEPHTAQRLIYLALMAQAEQTKRVADALEKMASTVGQELRTDGKVYGYLRTWEIGE